MDYKDLVDSSKVWVYQSSRNFTPKEVATIQSLGKEFVQDWAYHGAALRAAVEVFHQRFVVVFLDENQAAAGGCAIDKSVGLIREIQSRFNCELLDRMQVAYRQNGIICTMHLHAFQTALKNGTLSADTIVFNNLVINKEGILKQWEVPVSESWHAQLLQPQVQK